MQKSPDSSLTAKENYRLRLRACTELRIDCFYDTHQQQHLEREGGVLFFTLQFRPRARLHVGGSGGGGAVVAPFL